MDVNSFASSASPASPVRILLVDDNADMREYLQHLLSKRWSVKAVENGAVALALVQDWMPDLILSDVMMPELDGFGLLQAIRANPRTQGIPVILLSARAGEEAAIEGLEAGADDYLIKPFSARELMTRVNTNLQMARLRQERSANRLKDEFLATVTHELNAPLAAILTWARLLQTKPFDRPMTLRTLETIERNASNQAKLIEDLLNVSSILAGKRGLNPQPVDLVSIIDDVLNTLYPTAQAKAIALQYGIDDFGLDSDSPAASGVHSKFKTPTGRVSLFGKASEYQRAQTSKFTVSGEPKRLRQIVANLLSNAIKFTPEGGQIKVQLNTDVQVTHLPPKSPNFGGLQSSNSPQDWGARGAKFAQITITDTRIGISADFLPYVFDRFAQAEVPSRHTPGGVGIGLAIAHHLVELHGGTIEVASEGEGYGATFTVKLRLMTSAQLNDSI
ncbi:MAG TPA: hybrid sensor histidine kinase/response regulator [Microcoleaceae cyanobacterium]